MAARTAPKRPVTRPDPPERASRPKLRVIDQKRVTAANRRRRLIVGVAGAVVIGMFVSAMAQAELVRGQQELNQLRADVAEAEGARADLEREIVVASAPQVIVEQARALGMVRAMEPQYFPAIRSVGTP